VGARGTKGGKQPHPIKTVNLKHDHPTVSEALSRLDREIGRARQGGTTVLKVVHGYGSSGVGGDIRIAIQARLRGMAEEGRIRHCIFGECWSKSNEATWRLLQDRAELKQDSDLGRANRGITIVVLFES
jgi:hypothetical protein